MSVRTIIRSANENEDGHVRQLPGALVAAAGAILLGIGAANDTGWMAVVGGITAGVGILAGVAMHHIMVDYEIFRRLDNLEKK